MIEVDETKPIEASLTIRLTGEDIETFKGLVWWVHFSCDLPVSRNLLATRLLENIDA